MAATGNSHMETNTVKMKKSKLKLSRKKVIPHYFQKKNNSNTSLSQLLHIVSYKKRVNDLAYNNKSLARELQAARCEIANQNRKIDMYASEKNQIMFAKLKMVDMAKSIAKLVEDMNEVRSYLDFDSKANEVKFQTTKGFPCSKAMPTVDCIEEVSVLSTSECATSDEGSNQIPELDRYSPVKPLVEENGAVSTEMDLLTEENCSENYVPFPADALMDTLNVDESGNPKEQSKKQKSSKSKISDKQKSGHMSLTPELDIDFHFIPRKKSSSRRQTLFKVSDSRRTKSKEKVISPELDLCPLSPLETLDNDDVGKLENAVLSPKDNKKNNNSQISPVLKDSAAKSICPNDLKTFDVQPICAAPKVLTKSPNKRNYTLLLDEDMELTDIISTNPIIVADGSAAVLNPVIASEIQPDTTNKNISLEVKEAVKRKSTISKRPPNISKSDKQSINVDAIHYCSPGKEKEFFETSKNNHAMPNIVTDDSAVVLNPIVASEIQPDTTNKNISLEVKEAIKRKSSTISKRPPNISKSRKQSINVDAIPCGSLEKEKESFEASKIQHALLFDSFKTPSPQLTRRRRKPVKYFYFSSSDSELDTPRISKSRKKMSSFDETRTTAIFIPKSLDMTKDCLSLTNDTVEAELNPAAPVKSCSKIGRNNKSSKKFALDAEDNTTFDFNFNVSHSEKIDSSQDPNFLPKKSKLSKKRKPVKTKTPSKPLLHKCDVIKKKGFDYKFSKRKSSIRSPKRSSVCKQTKIIESPSNKITCSSPGLSACNLNSQIVDNSLDQETLATVVEKDLTCSVQKEYRCALKSPSTTETPKQPNVLENSLVRSETKRVSFATTDVVCNFKKMSLCKTIAANAKVKRASKSAASENDEPLQTVDMFSRETDIYPEILFNLDEETEMYNFSSLVNAQCSGQESVNQHPLKVVAPICVRAEKSRCDKTQSNKNKVKKKTVKISGTGKVSCQQKLPKKLSAVVTDFKSSKSLSPKEKNKNSALLNTKENSNLQYSETVKSVKKPKQKYSKRCVPLLPHNNKDSPQMIAVDDICRYRVPENEKSEEKIKENLPSPLPVESSHVVMKLSQKGSLNREILEISNSGDQATKDLPKRRPKSKPSYLEPSLRTKMRR